MKELLGRQAMHCSPDAGAALRNLLWVAMVLAVAVYAAVVVRNVTDVLIGITGDHMVTVAVDRPAR